jgi:peptidoglycan/LPS O-acetylase OafA/YrhL
LIVGESIRYRPELDGLRAIAVLAVVLHHLWPGRVPGGFVGVDVFFVLSGFLITGIVAREAGAGTFSFAKFYERRVRRLFPALFVVLAATLVASWFLLLPSDAVATFRAVVATLLFSSNMLFWKSLAAGYFAGDAKLNPLLHTWSLGVEEQFYLLFPLVLLFLLSKFARWTNAMLVGALIASLAACELLVRDHPVAVFFLSPFRAWELLFGALLALDAVPPLRSAAAREVVGLIGLAAIATATFCYSPATSFPGVSALLPVAGTAAVIHATTGQPTRVAQALQFRPLVYVGLISYSLYLWHWPLIVFARFASGMEQAPGAAWLLLAASVALAALSHRFVEQPFRRPRSVSRRTVFRASALAACALVATSSWAMAGGANRARYDAATLQFDAARHVGIPFVACDRAAGWCRLGDASAAPTVFLWGDSHLLAWAPALDRELAARGIAAYMAIDSACPPIAGAESAVMPGCTPLNARAEGFIRAHPALDQVVLFANWKAYLGRPSTLVHPSSAPDQLRATITAIRAPGRRVEIVGPVPVYADDVPLALALGRGRAGSLGKTRDAHQREQNAFYGLVPVLQVAGATVVDPAEWICPRECAVASAGTALYRDAEHLSVDGAMAYAAPLGHAVFGTRAAGALPQRDAGRGVAQ